MQWLRDGLGEDLSVVVGEGASARVIPKASVTKFLDTFRDVGDITPSSGSSFAASFPADRRLVVHLRQNKASFGVQIPRLSRVRIVDKATQASLSLSRIVQERECLHVTTNDVRYAFANGQLFLDERIGAQARAMAKVLHAESALNTCTSEKGEGSIGAATSAFPPRSIFHAIETRIATDDDLLLCEDRDAEWADYIGIKIGPPPRITLYHAKHGNDGAADHATTSASRWQEVLGQATKNIARLTVVTDDLAAKRGRWADTWNGRPCRIARLRKGLDVNMFCDRYVEASASPALQKRICVVASFAAKPEIENVIDDAINGRIQRPWHSQLIWFLVSFVSTCREVGAEAHLVVGA